MPLAVGLVSLAATSAVHDQARAQGSVEPPQEVDLILADCPEVSLDFGSLFAALRLELEHDGVVSVAAATTPRSEASASIEVAIPCSPQTRAVRIRVRSAKDSPADRNMTISDLPRRLRARAVALAAAELARSSWLRSEPNLQKGTPEDAPSAATSGDLGGPNASDSTPAHGPPAAQPATNAARDPVGASSVASPFAGGARPNGMPAPPGSTHPEVRRTPFAVAVGPIARFFLPETTPAYGGRVSLRVGRMHAGSDFVAQFPESLRDLALGVATLWSAWDMVFYERPRFRAAVGPHVALGVAWSPAYARSVAVSFPASGGALASEASDREPGARTAFYAEGAVAAEAFLQVGPGWACGAILELGAAWGAAATSLYPSQSDVPQAWHPVQAGAVGGPTMGASLVLGYTP